MTTPVRQPYTRLLFRMKGLQGEAYVDVPSTLEYVVRNIDVYSYNLGVGDSNWFLKDLSYSDAVVVWLQWSGVGPSGRGWEGRQVFAAGSSLHIVNDNGMISDVSITGYVFSV